MPDRTTFNGDDWKAYTRVNELFATKTVEALTKILNTESIKETPLIWIHDFQLMLTANWIRQVCFFLLIRGKNDLNFFNFYHFNFLK